MDSIALKTCTRCHADLPSDLQHFLPDKRLKCGLTGHCRACGSRLRKEARAKGLPEEAVRLARARSVRWRELHREEARADSRRRNAERYAASPQAENERTKAWRAANPHKIKRYSALYLEANRDQLRVKDALYRRMNPEWASAHRQLRRARERAVPGSYTKEELIALYVA